MSDSSNFLRRQVSGATVSKEKKYAQAIFPSWLILTMRLLVILTAVSTVIAIPFPARPNNRRPRFRPPKDDLQWGIPPIVQPNTQPKPGPKANPGTESEEPTSVVTPVDETLTPDEFKDVDVIQQASDNFDQFVDANTAVLDYIGKVTGIGMLGAGVIGAGAGAADFLFPDGIPTLPSIPDGSIFGN